ncbi:MAG: aldo/keto reductase [Armatimonadetes bacterium]|nr:aldo/keto reductase [Armatimonadota bacterium]
MQYGQIPGIDKPFSRLVQGTTMIGSGDIDGSFALLDGVLELGYTVFDTAHIYGGGDNERTLGRWISDRGVRDRVVILAKGAHLNADRRRVTPWDITSDLYDSLARFKTDYIDLYVLHRDDPDFPVEPIVDILNEHARAGRIRAFGGSNWTHDRIQQANSYATANGLIPFAVSNPQFSLAVQKEEPWDECVSITGPEGAQARKYYQESQIPLLLWSSVAGGFFSGRFRRDNLDSFTDGSDQLCVRCYATEENFQRLDRAEEMAAGKGVTAYQIALAWVLAQPQNTFPLVGARTVEEARQNAEALEIKLTPQESAWLNLESGSL